MRLVGGRFEQLRAEVGCRLRREMRRQHAAQAELGQARIAIAQACHTDDPFPLAGEGRVRAAAAGALPDRQHAERLGNVLDVDLGAQLVEAQALDQRRCQRPRAIEIKSAAIGGAGLGEEKIDDDLALRSKQRAEAGLLRRHLADVGVTSPLRNLRASSPATLTTPRSGRSAAFIIPGCSPDVASKRRSLAALPQERQSGNDTNSQDVC